MIHAISLYDILNKCYLDLEVQPAKEKINSLPCAGLWTDILMVVPRFSLRTGDLPVIMSLPMPLKTTLILPILEAGCGQNP